MSSAWGYGQAGRQRETEGSYGPPLGNEPSFGGCSYGTVIFLERRLLKQSQARGHSRSQDCYGTFWKVHVPSLLSPKPGSREVIPSPALTPRVWFPNSPPQKCRGGRAVPSCHRVRERGALTDGDVPYEQPL